MARWWDEWQLRILVLCSLCAQYFLALFTGVRKFRIPPWLRFSIRLAHIGSDALALFALATLFDRQKNGPKCSYTRGSHDLELLWAPILLMHLGGQVIITAHKIEDNEEWSRHILTSLSKVTVAIYVLYKSWSSTDTRLLAATILLFILVVLRCFQKALRLKYTGFKALRQGRSLWLYIHKYDDDKLSLIEYVKVANEVFRARDAIRPTLSPEEGFSMHKRLFVDLACSYADRLETLKSFWVLDKAAAYKSIEDALSDVNSFLYTKDDATILKLMSIRYICYLWIVLIAIDSPLITAIGLFHSRHNKSYSGEDVRVTTVLLYGTLLLEILSLSVRSAFRGKFSGAKLAQHSLIRSFGHSKRHAKLMRIASCFGCEDIPCWQMEPSDSCREITELVRQHLEFGWKTYISDDETYKMFNDMRGEITLERNGVSQQLGWGSFRRPFDGSILLWHMATEFCFHCMGSTSPNHEHARRSREISNYMMHLLCTNPEMLMPGSRWELTISIYSELWALLRDEVIPPDDKETTLKIIDKLHEKELDQTSYVANAWALAQKLMSLPSDGELAWKVIQGVWVEMLCYSAGRCRGYLHAESLGTGVEYLSYVWLLLAYSGMETFPDKLQRREPRISETQHSLV